MMRLGIAADHGAYLLKEQLTESLHHAGYDVEDFGAHQWNAADDYPDFIIPLARAVASREVGRGIALCGSGIGASIAANKVLGARAGLMHDTYSAHQGVEDDDVNICCFGAKVIGPALAWDLLEVFLGAHFSESERFARRLAKVNALEHSAYENREREKPEAEQEAPEPSLRRHDSPRSITSFLPLAFPWSPSPQNKRAPSHSFAKENR